VAVPQRPVFGPRQINLRFIVSGKFNYSTKICADSGPLYAKSLGLTAISADSALDEEPGTFFIVDNTLEDSEVEIIRVLIDRQSSPVLLKVVDPCWSRLNRPPNPAPYFKLIEDFADRAHVGIVSMYEPSEWLEDVLVQKQPKLLTLPYPYSITAEEPLRAETFKKRLDKAILSGAKARDKYPARARLHWRRWISKRYRDGFDVLEHPGYPAAGESLKHRHLFGDFVRYLATYKYCFLCPSRADLEFLKFTECAYAGCVPVGVAASSMPREARELFLSEKGFLDSLRTQPAAKRNRDHFERAQAYRQLMSACRRPDDLHEQLMRFLRSNF
jgi:hypothetical protein